MLQRLGFSSFLAVALVATATLSASAAGKVPADVKVITMIADKGPTSVNLRVGSDGQGAYPGTDPNIKSVIASNMQGNFWILTTYYTSKGKTAGRTVFFDLSEPAGDNLALPPIVDQAPALLVANCYKAVPAVNMLTMTAGQVNDCPGGFRFQAQNTLWYRLSFQPDNFPGVDRLKVACVTSDSAGCKTWTISANGTPLGTDPNPKSKNRLVQIDPGSDAVIRDDFGYYYISFSIDVSR